MLPELLNQIPSDQQFGSVTADGPYDTGKCHDAIHCPEVHVLRARERLTADLLRSAIRAELSSHGSQAPMALSLGTMRSAPRSIWAGHCGGTGVAITAKSRVGTNPLMVCMQTTAGQRMARDFDRQVVEVQVRIAILNGYAALGIPVTKFLGLIRLAKGEHRPSADLCNRVATGV